MDFRNRYIYLAHPVEKQKQKIGFSYEDLLNFLLKTTTRNCNCCRELNFQLQYPFSYDVIIKKRNMKKSHLVSEDFALSLGVLLLLLHRGDVGLNRFNLLSELRGLPVALHQFNLQLVAATS